MQKSRLILSHLFACKQIFRFKNYLRSRKLIRWYGGSGYGLGKGFGYDYLGMYGIIVQSVKNSVDWI